jgi:hypothetical protein
MQSHDAAKLTSPPPSTCAAFRRLSQNSYPDHIQTEAPHCLSNRDPSHSRNSIITISTSQTRQATEQKTPRSIGYDVRCYADFSDACMTNPPTRSGGRRKGPILQLMPVCARLCFNRLVIRWMPANLLLARWRIGCPIVASTKSGLHSQWRGACQGE